jgi:type I restriction enzyme, R subunit
VVDIDVESIDKAEVMEAPERLEGVVDYIIANHTRKTHNKRFTAIFCVPNVNTLIEYYKLFKAKKLNGDHDLKIGTIFSYQANEEDADATGEIDVDPMDMQQAAEDPADYETKHTREHLEDFIQDYNKMFKRNYSTNDFYSYYKDIGRQVKDKQLDILLVVNMFLTGFDSKTLNTIYVDKNLRYHGLIQAYSRTNRILNELKSQGNVVAFRNLKKRTDEAITLFSNKDAIEDIILQPYENYVDKFDQAIKRLLEITPTVDSVNDLPSENEEFEFVTAFRELLRIKNVLNTFTEFNFQDLDISEQTFEDYKSKYLDIRDKVRNDHSKEQVSILDDIDFEVELIHRDEVNVVYILTLLADLKDAKPDEQAKKKKQISDMMGSEAQLRSKKELIERFITENLPMITDRENIPEEFESFWTVEKMKALEDLSIDENLDQEKLNKLIANYLFTEKQPLRDEVIETMKEKPGLRERKTSSERIIDKIKGFIETFINGMG